MPRFKFRITNNTTESCDLIVEADTLREAFDEGLANVEQYRVTDWGVDDSNTQRPYVADLDDYSEVQWTREEPNKEFPFEDWKYNVTNNVTQLGYHEWVENMRKMPTLAKEQPCRYCGGTGEIKLDHDDARAYHMLYEDCPACRGPREEPVVPQPKPAR